MEPASFPPSDAWNFEVVSISRKIFALCIYTVLSETIYIYIYIYILVICRGRSNKMGTTGFPQFQERESFTFFSVVRFNLKKSNRYPQFDDDFIRAHW
jgi:hypothetical protein